MFAKLKKAATGKSKKGEDKKKVEPDVTAAVEEPDVKKTKKKSRKSLTKEDAAVDGSGEIAASKEKSTEKKAKKGVIKRIRKGRCD